MNYLHCFFSLNITIFSPLTRLLSTRDEKRYPFYPGHQGTKRMMGERKRARSSPLPPIHPMPLFFRWLNIATRRVARGERPKCEGESDAISLHPLIFYDKVGVLGEISWMVLFFLGVFNRGRKTGEVFLIH